MNDTVTISRKTLIYLRDAAQSYLDDLTTGLNDGTYEEGEDEVQPLEVAIEEANKAIDLD